MLCEEKQHFIFPFNKRLIVSCYQDILCRHCFVNRVTTHNHADKILLN